MENVRKYRNNKLYTIERRRRKKLLGVRTKLSHDKVFYRESITNKNEKNSNTYK